MTCASHPVFQDLGVGEVDPPVVPPVQPDMPLARDLDTVKPAQSGASRNRLLVHRLGGAAVRCDARRHHGGDDRHGEDSDHRQQCDLAAFHDVSSPLGSGLPDRDSGPAISSMPMPRSRMAPMILGSSSRMNSSLISCSARSAAFSLTK